jgi:hypothetical protein
VWTKHNSNNSKNKEKRERAQTRRKTRNCYIPAADVVDISDGECDIGI